MLMQARIGLVIKVKYSSVFKQDRLELMVVCSNFDPYALEDPGTCELMLGYLPLIVVRWQGGWRVYRNYCPHLGISLNFVPDEFLDSEKNHLICANHGALFEIEQGHCISGPCVGQKLIAIPCEVSNGQLWVELEQ